MPKESPDGQGASPADDAGPAEPTGSAEGAASHAPSRGRTLARAASERWRQLPAGGTRASSTPLSRRDIVNGLDRREVTVGVSLALFDLIIAVFGYRTDLHSATKSVREGATEFLVAGLVGTLVITVGVLVRRRALLGFACFMSGLEFQTYHLTIGAVLFLGAGGWLIFRVTQKQKQDRLLTRSTTSRAPKSPSPKPAARPKASKRYTPPRKATSGRRP